MTTGIATRFMTMVNQARYIFAILRQFGENIFRAFFNTARSLVTNFVSNVRTGFINRRIRLLQ